MSKFHFCMCNFQFFFIYNFFRYIYIYFNIYINVSSVSCCRGQNFTCRTLVFPCPPCPVSSCQVTQVRNQHLINVLGVSATGAMFLAAHDSSSIIASSQNISDLLLKTINDVGLSNVIQVITDNAANCKGAGKIIERAHPHIFWSGCLVHTLNLLMHDICQAQRMWMD